MCPEPGWPHQHPIEHPEQPYFFQGSRGGMGLDQKDLSLGFSKDSNG